MKKNNKEKKQKEEPKKLLCPKAGTATSSPSVSTTSQSINIVNVILYMKKNAYAETTIKATAKRLRHLRKHCDLTKPEEVKLFIARKNCGNAFKETLIECYAIMMNSLGLKWNQPFYARYDKLPKIPKEEQLNMIIAHAIKRMSLFLSMSKDLGSRPIELTWLRVKDIDLQKGIVNLTGAKYTIGRNDYATRNNYVRTMKYKKAKYHQNKIKFISIYPRNLDNLDWIFKTKFRKVTGINLPN